MLMSLSVGSAVFWSHWNSPSRISIATGASPDLELFLLFRLLFFLYSLVACASSDPERVRECE